MNRNHKARLLCYRNHRMHICCISDSPPKTRVILSSLNKILELIF